MKTVILLIIAITSFAKESIHEIRGKKINFFYNEKLRLVSSIECKINKKGTDCENFNFIKKLTAKNINRKVPGGMNLGAEICKSVLKGESLIGRDSDNNESSFCKIDEKLYVDNGSLEYLADMNDGVVYEGRKNIPGE